MADSGRFEGAKFELFHVQEFKTENSYSVLRNYSLASPFLTLVLLSAHAFSTYFCLRVSNEPSQQRSVPQNEGLGGLTD